MNNSAEYKEEIELYAPENDIDSLSQKLQGAFKNLEPELVLRDVFRTTLEQDIMGLKNYWSQRFGDRINPESHVLTQLNFLFASGGSLDPDELSDRTYKIVSHILQPIDGIEYFSTFGDIGI